MNNQKILIDTLHTLFCSKPHVNAVEDLTKDRDQTRCYFYVEESVSTCEELPDHVFWKEQAESLMQTLGSATPSSALASIYRVLDLVEKINHLSGPERELCKRLVSDSLSD